MKLITIIHAIERGVQIMRAIIADVKHEHQIERKDPELRALLEEARLFRREIAP